VPGLYHVDEKVSTANPNSVACAAVAGGTGGLRPD
jgi:hypothetical protein